MKETSVTRFEAFDGELFGSAAECIAYEKAAGWRQLVGLTEEQVQAGLSRENEAIAEAFEAAGKAVVAARKSAGILKRTPKKPKD